MRRGREAASRSRDSTSASRPDRRRGARRRARRRRRDAPTNIVASVARNRPGRRCDPTLRSHARPGGSAGPRQRVERSSLRTERDRRRRDERQRGAACLPSRPLNASSATATSSPGSGPPASAARPIRSSRPPRTRHTTDRGAEHHRDQHRRDDEEQRAARGRQHPREHVATEHVGSERMRGRHALAHASRSGAGARPMCNRATIAVNRDDPDRRDRAVRPAPARRDHRVDSPSAPNGTSAAPRATAITDSTNTRPAPSCGSNARRASTSSVPSPGRPNTASVTSVPTSSAVSTSRTCARAVDAHRRAQAPSAAAGRARAGRETIAACGRPRDRPEPPRDRDRGEQREHPGPGTALRGRRHRRVSPRAHRRRSRPRPMATPRRAPALGQPFADHRSDVDPAHRGAPEVAVRRRRRSARTGAAATVEVEVVAQRGTRAGIAGVGAEESPASAPPGKRDGSANTTSATASRPAASRPKRAPRRTRAISPTAPSRCSRQERSAATLPDRAGSGTRRTDRPRSP